MTGPVVWSASNALRHVFKDDAERLSSSEKDVLMQDVRALAEELAAPDQELDLLDAATELRQRIGGVHNLKAYVESLMAGRRGGNPCVPHGTFARIRRAVARRGDVDDPDALAAWIKRRMRKNPQTKALSESAELWYALSELDKVLPQVEDRGPVFFAVKRVVDVLTELFTQASMGVHRNPLLAVANPATTKRMSDKVEEVRYRHVEDGKYYKHPFAPGVLMEAQIDGTILLRHRDGKPLWKDFA